MSHSQEEGKTVRVLFLIEDIPFSFDNRVRREAATLRDMGMAVSVISRRHKGEPWYDVVDGIRVYRYPCPDFGAGILAHIAEYSVALIAQSVLTAWVAVRYGFDVIHVANPPDLLWLVAAPYRLLLGKRFVFDHHDLVPELYDSRFGKCGKFMRAVLCFLERRSFRLANHVISTNESYRSVAMSRGGKHANEVTVVRNGPSPHDFADGEPNPAIRRLGGTVVGYLGTMNPQDGAHQFVEMARLLHNVHGRRDIGFVMIGGGDSFNEIVQLRDESGLKNRIVMTGRIPWCDVISALRATDICVQPDPPGPLNDCSTMNKLMEYMALGRAVVSFDLIESRVSGGDAIFYAKGGGAEGLASAILELTANPELMQSLQCAAQERVRDVLSWEHQAARLGAVYVKLFPGILHCRDVAITDVLRN